MPTLLKIMADVVRRLAGTGAADNAAHEVDRALRAVVDVDAQLHRASEPLPRRAA
ncbi:MAG TPA: hypothetical protein VKR22_14530 [Acidimicrobiales bacterium]|nr:hypothetical protein [Acidimicrobiales bacterium]